MSGPHVIRPTAVYTLTTAQEALGLNASTLGREIRLGRLRSAKRAGKVFILGRWLLAWLERGARGRKRRAATAGEGNGHPGT
jgi:hypothetical protein